MKVINDDDDERKNSKKRSLSQMIDQVMTIKTSTGSSKTELSSKGKRPFKVFRFSHVFRLTYFRGFVFPRMIRKKVLFNSRSRQY